MLLNKKYNSLLQQKQCKKKIQLRLDKLSINGINQNMNQIQTITKDKSK